MGAGEGWKAAFFEATASSNTCFIVCLNGVAGETVESQVMGAAQAAGRGGAFNFEMMQLYQQGLLPTVRFFANGHFCQTRSRGGYV
jgi:hypothetical protein